MKHLIRLFTCAAVLHSTLLLAAPKVTLTTDREDALYQCGETATFTLSVTDNGAPVTSGTVQVRLGAPGDKDLLNQSFDLAKANPAQFTGTLDQPGFLLASAAGIPDAPKALAGAGFEPQRILPGNELPEDFSAFWEAGRRELADKPVRLEKLDAFSTPQYTSYALTVDVLHGEHLYGFLTVPNQPGKHPAVVTIPGAGPGVASPFVEQAKRGILSFVLNVHKYPVVVGNPEATKKHYEDQTARLPYQRDQAGDRDRYHFRNVILGMDRAITEIARRPDWDGQHLVLDGSSQGGGLALILAGFNPHVTAAAANVPALGDHAAGRFHRAPAWPNLASAGPEALAVSAYYDTANFAPGIRCPVLVSAGFIDTTCPPASIYAAWNRIPSEHKTLLNQPRSGHEISKEYEAKKTPWINTQLGLTPP